MNINGFSIRPISEPIDGDTRYRNIKGYAITDGEDHVVAEFDTFAMVSAAWDMIVDYPENYIDVTDIFTPEVIEKVGNTLRDGDAREA